MKKIRLLLKSNLKKYIELIKINDHKINNEKITIFCIFLIILILFDIIFFKQNNFWQDKFLIFLIFIPILYLFILKSLLKNKNQPIYFYMVILIIVLIYYFHINNFYYILPLVLLISTGPLLNLNKILICLAVAITFNLIDIYYYNHSIMSFKNIIIVYIFILIYSQILYIKYNEILYDKILLKEKNNKLLTQIETDKLTGLLNRYGMQNKLEDLTSKKDFLNKSCALLLLDIDDFKKHNDAFGHLEGDTCLIKISEQLKLSVKSKFDFIARFGGEEFILLIFNVNEKQSIEISKRICKNIEDLKIPTSKITNSKYLTMSIGISIYEPDTEFDFYELVKEADKQLYLVKNAKKNAMALNNKIYSNY